jgi:hypothetical protein
VWITALCMLLGLAGGVSAQADPKAVLEISYTPAARAQVAIWIETEEGVFMSTVRLTEAVAYRGIGNRPGASEMNSGYRWPYGRREGVLPIWGTRRAQAPGAQPFPRVVFQSRVEGLASRTTSDQSADDYYCLSFNKANSARDALDAVSCASVFTSDKGRYLTNADLLKPYAEPYEEIDTFDSLMQAMPATSIYPPRMDVTRCVGGGCYDAEDVEAFADDARAVMPDIDAVTMATTPGDMPHSVLFSVPANWPRGNYAVWLEVNVEGDYNSTWNATTYRTPTTPSGTWDSWAMQYGYAYRGQPSVVFKVPFVLDDLGNTTFSVASPAGRASWDVWASGFGQLEALTDITDNPNSAPGSGADRLRKNGSGQRLTVQTSVFEELPEPGGPDDPTDPDAGVSDPGPIDPTQPEAGSGAVAGATGGSGEGAAGEGASSGGDADKGSAGAEDEPRDDEEAMRGRVIEDSGGGTEGPVGAIYDLELSHHGNELRAHTWIHLRFAAPRSDKPLHSYDVRTSTSPIVDEATFIRNGRQARSATDDAEGATLLMLPTDAKPGEMIDTSIGDLVAQTRYYVAVRATDRLNRHGPITVAEITTRKRVFATVTPCFIASAAYGSPLAAEVSVLREVRDRYLMTHAPGRALVAAYYAVGPSLASAVQTNATLRAAVRAVLQPLVALAGFVVDAP